MGKLHTLKRAILRNPDEWYKKQDFYKTLHFADEHKFVETQVKTRTKIIFRSAKFKDGKWIPSDFVWFGNCRGRSYVAFVRSVLIKNGLVALSDME